MSIRRLVILESPFAADTPDAIAQNIDYAREAVRDSLVNYGEAPIASHLLYTQPGILDDKVPAERAMGMQAGLAWGVVAEGSVVYVDRGMSPGMRAGITKAANERRPIAFRSLDPRRDPHIVQAEWERRCNLSPQVLPNLGKRKPI